MDQDLLQSPPHHPYIKCFPTLHRSVLAMQSWEPDGLLALKVGLEVAPQHGREGGFVCQELLRPQVPRCPADHLGDSFAQITFGHVV